MKEFRITSWSIVAIVPFSMVAPPFAAAKPCPNPEVVATYTSDMDFNPTLAEYHPGDPVHNNTRAHFNTSYCQISLMSRCSGGALLGFFSVDELRSSDDLRQ